MRARPGVERRMSPVLAAERAAIDTDAIPVIAPDGGLVRGEKMDVHRRGLPHLAVSVFVFDGGHLLIQRRAAAKYHCGLLWANTCCSHPHWGESLETAARRRLREELGLDLALTQTATLSYHAPVTMGLTENERVTVFHAEADRRTLLLNPDPAEVAEIEWIALPALFQRAHDAPEAFAPWFRIYLKRWAELGL
jgi:isopentenyl-diphosphate Delta-isomerase